MKSLLLVFLTVALCTSCRTPVSQQTRYAAPKGKFSPVVIANGTQKSLNKLGTVRACGHTADSTVSVDPTRPAMYHEVAEFATERGSYRNHIYRLHFEKVPVGHLAMGKNVGLFVIVTENETNAPVLITTVHTCGCYAAIVPTSYLPAECLPAEWCPAEQDVYGEQLTGLLEMSGLDLHRWRPEIELKADSHRVQSITNTQSGWDTTRLLPMNDLLYLPVEDGTVSMFHGEDDGDRQGYVRGSLKPGGQALMGWWTEPYIGRDKALGDEVATGTRFYTSVNPFKRDASNLWHFGRWLENRGWRL